jgi:hypothetical protein
MPEKDDLPMEKFAEGQAVHSQQRTVDAGLADALQQKSTWNVLSGIVSRLAADLRLPYRKDPDKLLSEANPYELLNNNLTYRRSKLRNLSRLAGTKWHFEKTEGSHEAWVVILKKIFEKIVSFTESRERMGEAAWTGRTWFQIDYKKKIIPIGNTKVLLGVPHELVLKSKAMFEFQTSYRSAGIIDGYWARKSLNSRQTYILQNHDMYNLLTVAYRASIDNW